jgi:hypothetical protein
MSVQENIESLRLVEVFVCRLMNQGDIIAFSINRDESSTDG